MRKRERENSPREEEEEEERKEPEKKGEIGNLIFTRRCLRTTISLVCT